MLLSSHAFRALLLTCTLLFLFPAVAAAGPPGLQCDVQAAHAGHVHVPAAAVGDPTPATTTITVKRRG